MVRAYFGSRVPEILRNAPFRRYWTGYSLSQLGDQVGGIALPLTAVLALNADSEAMGILSAIGLLPALLFSIHAGAWVDRSGRRRQAMMVADIARAALLACIPLGFALGWLTLPGLLGISFLMGVCSMLYRVSSSTLFVSMVPKERYVEANSLLQGSSSVAFLTGPSIGGFLVQAFSAPVALLADALSFVASAVSLARIRPEEPPPTEVPRGQVAAGFRFILASPVLRALLATMATISFCQAVFFALYVLYVTRTLAVTPAELGLILGPSSVGALLGSALAGRISKWMGLGRTLLVGTILYTVPLLLVPLAGGTHVMVLACLFVSECFSGMGFMVREISGGAILAAAIPDSIRARAGGAMEFVRMGIRPVGALLGGWVAARVGLQLTLWIATLGAALAFLWLLPSPIIRLRDVDDYLPREVV